MKVGSLFSGAGCGDLGLEWAGFKHAWFCEQDKYARKILDKNWPGATIYEDIRNVDFTQVEPVELLAGGFPCQDISVAGKGEGIQGERSGLWSEFARAIAEIRPLYALIENSPALATRGLDVVLSDLAALGYDAEWHCLPASALGAPHHRDRMWIVAYPQLCRIQERRRVANSRKETVRPGGIRPNGAQGGEEQARSVVADTMRPGRKELDIATLAQRAGQRAGCIAPAWGKAWWASESGLVRVAHGTPNRVDRIRCVGNGQLPHCTCFWGLVIQEHYQATISK